MKGQGSCPIQRSQPSPRLTGSTTETVGRFSYDVPTDTWWWSTSLYTIHGFTPGEIVPTTALMMAHQHPDDRAGAIELITAAVTAGKPFCSRHRILDAQQRIHTVVTIGEGVRDDRRPDRAGQRLPHRRHRSLHRDLSRRDPGWPSNSPPKPGPRSNRPKAP